MDCIRPTQVSSIPTAVPMVSRSRNSAEIFPILCDVSGSGKVKMAGLVAHKRLILIQHDTIRKIVSSAFLQIDVHYESAVQLTGENLPDQKFKQNQIEDF